MEDGAAKDGGGEVTLSDLRREVAEFARARDWEQFHSPRNLLLALVGEVGELSEIFQWRGEVEGGLLGWPPEDKEHVAEELSDVLLYLVRLADVCGVDLSLAALSKLRKNALKYPVHLCSSSSRKYTALHNLPREKVDPSGHGHGGHSPNPPSSEHSQPL